MPRVNGRVVTTPEPPTIHFIWPRQPTFDADDCTVTGPNVGVAADLVGWDLAAEERSDKTTWAVQLTATPTADRTWLVPSTLVHIRLGKSGSNVVDAVVEPPSNGHAAVQSGFDDLVGFPLITESAVGGGTSGSGWAGGQALVDAAFQRGLGRKPARGDVRGMLALMDGAMEQVEQDGILRWEMRAPGAVVTQTDGGAGVTGRQFSLANLAQSTEEDVAPLVEAVEAVVEPTGNPGLLDVYRANFLASLREAVAEASAPGGPLRLKAQVLLEQCLATLGAFGEQLGMLTRSGTWILTRDNVVVDADEEQFTKLLVIVDRYVVFDDFFRAFLGLQQVAAGVFDRTLKNQADLGLQFTLLDRRLDVIAEAVDELTDALRSVGVGRQEIEALLIDPGDPTSPAIADLLDWAHRFASSEARPLVQGAGVEGARLLIGRINGLGATATTLLATVQGSAPKGIGHPRVRVAAQKLVDELGHAQAEAVKF